jgi:hypothetical protein
MLVAKFKEVVFPRQLIKENEASCMVDCSSIRIGNWSETCKQRIPVLLCGFWRWVAVLHVNIIVSIGIKLASGKMEEIAIFISNQIRSSLSSMVESNDIDRVISAHKAFAKWLTEGLLWIHSIPIFSLLSPIGS